MFLTMSTRIPSQPAAASSQAAADPYQPDAGWMSPRMRLIVSVIVFFHVTAVFWAPFTFACRVGADSSSPFAENLLPWLRPYISMMYLDHGYFFFAPNPGPSFLVKYKVEYPDGREPVEGVFPNLKEQQPRLLYHRYFMVSTALNNAYVPEKAPPEPSPPPINASVSSTEQRNHQRAVEAYRREKAFWQHRRTQYEALRNSIVRHLESQYPGGTVTITRLEHRPAAPAEVSEDKMPLTAPQTYRELKETDGE
jgi:hypothetical protein